MVTWSVPDVLTDCLQTREDGMGSHPDDIVEMIQINVIKLGFTLLYDELSSWLWVGKSVRHIYCFSL